MQCRVTYLCNSVGVLFLFVREAVTEPLVVDPVLLQGQVKHGEGGISGDLIA